MGKSFLHTPLVLGHQQSRTKTLHSYRIRQRIAVTFDVTASGLCLWACRTCPYIIRPMSVIKSSADQRRCRTERCSSHYDAKGRWGNDWAATFWVKRCLVTA